MRPRPKHNRVYPLSLDAQMKSLTDAAQPLSPQQRYDFLLSVERQLKVTRITDQDPAFLRFVESGGGARHTTVDDDQTGAFDEARALGHRREVHDDVAVRRGVDRCERHDALHVDEWRRTGRVHRFLHERVAAVAPARRNCDRIGFAGRDRIGDRDRRDGNAGHRQRIAVVPLRGRPGAG